MQDRPFEHTTTTDTHTVVIGCGNILRGDDELGPILIRQLFDEGFARRVTVVDGGTAGMDVAFKMRGATKVVLVDAFLDGPTATPGTIYQVPGSQLETLPDPSTFQSHSFRWDHSLAFARWLLSEDEYPKDVTVFLVSVSSTELGAELSDEIRSVLPRLKMLVLSAAGLATPVEVAISPIGVLKIETQNEEFDLPETVGVRLNEGVLEVYFLDDEGAGRPTKVLSLNGRRGVDVADLVENLGEEMHLQGIFDRAAQALRVPVGKANVWVAGSRS